MIPDIEGNFFGVVAFEEWRLRGVWVLEADDRKPWKFRWWRKDKKPRCFAEGEMA